MVKEAIESIVAQIRLMGKEEAVAAINEARRALHEVSPFRHEPVDFVEWIKKDDVVANDYNPNKVAPPEMQLLEVSIINDGYTQPIVTFPHDGKNEVVDGFHRSRVGKESKIVGDRVMGYLPVVSIRKEKEGKAERIASTIRHNRARGKHQVSAMSEIVIDLKNRNWNNSRIARELGMDEDEILRLCQVSGLESMFKDTDFSKAWVAEGSIEDSFEPIDDITNESDMDMTRIPLESDANRIFHTYDKWECVKYGFYESQHAKWTATQCEYKYAEMLRNIPVFEETLQQVISEWKHSCEHNLTNSALNRIAWLGQASLARRYQIPSKYRSGYQLLSDAEKDAANESALKYLNIWLNQNGLDPVDMETASQKGRQVELY